MYAYACDVQCACLCPCGRVFVCACDMCMFQAHFIRQHISEDNIFRSTGIAVRFIIV